MTRHVLYDEAVDSLEYTMANDSISKYWTGQDTEAEVFHCEGLLEHLATGTADNHEQPLSGHRLWSSVQQHGVISHTVTDVSTRKQETKKLHTENGAAVPVLTVKTYNENGAICPLIPNLGTRQRWQSGQLHPPPALPPRQRTPLQVQLGAGLAPQHVGAFWKEKTTSSLLEFESRILQPVL
jgi:hypothetical protein